MSIILKGIDMPKEKDEALLLLILGDGTVAEKIGSDRYEEMANTEVIQIPTPHGRIIDADLFKEIIKDSVPAWTIGVKIPTYGDMDIMDKIYYMPTILESED